MEIWQYEYQKRNQARPEVSAGESGDWSGFTEMMEQRDNLLKLLWESKVPGSRAPESLHLEMVQAWNNQGYDTTETETLVWQGLEALKNKDYRRLEVVSARIRHSLHRAPKKPGHPYWSFANPTGWPAIQAAFYRGRQGQKPEHPALTDDEDRLYQMIESGWLGQIAGGAYGTALEGYTGEVLREVYRDRLDYYVREPETYNDDITFQLAFLQALEEKGRTELTSDDIADKWLELIPFGWSAEYIALENLRRGIYPPRSGRFDNFFSEWIGAQMRGMVCGFAAPGDPLQAAHYAYLDGVVSHEKNGVYGEIHSAVLVSLAFLYDDTRTILERSRDYLPEGSQFTHYFDLALETARSAEGNRQTGGSGEGRPHLTAWSQLREELKKYNWIHTYPNLAAVVLSLWFCDNNFTRALRILADCGMDVDCNAGEVGSVIGVMDPQAITDRWTSPLNNQLRTYLPGLDSIEISRLAEWTMELIQR